MRRSRSPIFAAKLAMSDIASARCSCLWDSYLRDASARFGIADASSEGELLRGIGIALTNLSPNEMKNLSEIHATPLAIVTTPVHQRESSPVILGQLRLATGRRQNAHKRQSATGRLQSVWRGSAASFRRAHARLRRRRYRHGCGSNCNKTHGVPLCTVCEWPTHFQAPQALPRFAARQPPDERLAQFSSGPSLSDS